MQTAAERQPSEAEMRRRALKVLSGNADDERLAAEKVAQRARNAELRRSRMQLLASICVCFALIMGYMMLNTQVTTVGYEINQQMAANDDLRNENTRLLLQIEQETSPEKVSKFAEEHFNMVTPTEKSVIYYSREDMAKADTKVVRTGMAIDSQSIGSGTLEIVEEADSSGLLGMLASLWEQISTGSAISVGMRD